MLRRVCSAALLLLAPGVMAAILPRMGCGLNAAFQQDIAESVNQWCIACPVSPYECFPPHDSVTLQVQAEDSVSYDLNNTTDAFTLRANVNLVAALRDPVTNTSTGCRHLAIVGNASTTTNVSLASFQGLARLTSLVLQRVVLQASTPPTSSVASITIGDSTLPNTTLNLQAFEQLTTLAITNSSLSSCPSLAPAALATLSTLNLRGNALTTFPTQVLHLTHANVSIDLQGNPSLGVPTNATPTELATYASLLKSGQLLVDAATIATPAPTAATSNISPSMIDPTSSSKTPSSAGNALSWSTVLLIVAGCCIVAGVVFVLVFRHRKMSSFLTQQQSSLAASFLASGGDRAMSPFSAPARASPQFVPNVGPFPALASYRLLDASEFSRIKTNAATGILSAIYKSEPVMLKKLDVLAVQYDTHLDMFLRQLERASLLSHRNVVALLGGVQLSGIAIAGVFEGAEKGSLPSLLANDQVDLSWALKLQMATGLADGLAYLQEHTEDTTQWTSRDILVQQDYDCKWNIVRWFDDEGGPSLVRYGSATLAYVAPEALLSQPSTRGPMQVYTLGVFLGELATRLAPYAERVHELGAVNTDVMVAESYGASPLVPHAMMAEMTPEGYCAIVADCLRREPSARPTARDVVQRLLLL
ncbi:serine/threonine protein kinase [Saprolegnia diclina VS20]|uniref:Serine/threonine protein kinase n=1 Tax=Saprolegnia diclina (strain VS20) TaxID=1156394 RepID=T0QPL6_SAPDV|nr:serine/threonine protein kinase [Saprolegnia diclina VS20]EQC40049.1 serine/threonine protein kinase [Saprolegnia diclina VS20]|eukprot:XP_008606523.1 serine/threonine protein kinase [Saprolegnia diclina VS20]